MGPEEGASGNDLIEWTADKKNGRAKEREIPHLYVYPRPSLRYSKREGKKKERKKYTPR
jgi:hypothetical protein